MAFLLADLLAGWPPSGIASPPLPAAASSPPVGATAGGCPANCTTFFGPQRFDRAGGSATTYTTTVTVPSAVTAPLWLRVQNGEANGTHRVSSATIWLNGAQVAGPSDFGLGVSGFDRAVTLTTQTTLRIQLQSASGSYVYVRFCGQPVDHAPPQVSVALPAPGAVVTTPRPHLRVHYADSIASGDLWASGVNTSTLKVTLDGADRTSLFTKGPTDADGGLPASLALGEGAHALAASLKDNSGNAGSTSSGFTVVTKAPTLAVLSPAEAAVVGVTPTTVSGTAASADPHLTVACSVGPTTTTATRTGTAFSCNVVLVEGANAIRVTASDTCGHSTTLTRHVTLDSLAPVVAISAPVTGSFSRGTQINVTGTVMDAGSTGAAVTASVNGVPAAVQRTGSASFAFEASVPLGSADTTLTASATDGAGHVGQSPPVGVRVDRTLPQIALVQPAPAATVTTGTPHLRVHYQDAPGGGETAASGINTATLGVTVDGTDRTALFAKGPGDADADLTLSDGTHTVTAQVQDAVGNAGTTAATFSVQTAVPIVTIASPAEGALLRASLVTVTGSVSAADPSVAVQCQATTTVAASLNGGVFACAVGLAEGGNAILVTATDSHGRAGSASRSLSLDSVAPVVELHSPVAGAYTNETQVAVSGTLMDAGSTTTVPTVSVAGAAASVQRVGPTTFSYSATVPLPPSGDMTLQATATDAAGNVGSSVPVLVHVDHSPPVIRITSPAAGAILKSPIHVTGTVTDLAPGLVTLNGIPAPVTNGAFAADVPAGDGSLTLAVQAWDAAGNTASDSVDVVADSTPPAILLAAPADATLTSASVVHASGSVSDAHPASLTADGQDVPLAGNAFDVDIPLPAEGAVSIALVATDLAGNTGTRSLPLTVDRTAPQLLIVSPAADGLLATSPVTVQGTAADANGVTVKVDGIAATLTGQAWQAAIPLLGGDHTFSVVAMDGAGNTTTASRHVAVDLSAPVVTILSPAPGTLTRQPSIDVTGTVSGAASGATVVVGGVVTTVSPTLSFTAVGVALAEGDNVLQATATSAAGHSGAAAVLVTRDTTPPAVMLVAPETLARGQTATIAVAVTDANGVGAVVLKAGGSAIGTFTSPPYVAQLTIPASAQGGVTIVVSAEATDRAGNVGTATQNVRVAGSGVVVGQVLDDTTGLPLGGASVQLVSGSAGTVTTTTDDDGRYSLSVPAGQAILIAQKDGTSAVERAVAVDPAGGTVPVDARLTPLSASAAGVVAAGPVSVTLPAATHGRLTALSPQGLPGLLPLGFSPVVAFDLRSDPSTTGPLGGLVAVRTTDPLHLAQYDTTLHEWLMVAPNLTPGADGKLALTLPEIGAYALTVADVGATAPTVPPAGQLLTGAAMAPIPADATSATAVDPATLPPSGGQSKGTLALQSTVPLPSGTVVQAKVSETYTLGNGDVASLEPRVEDIVLYGRPVPTPPPSGAVAGTPTLYAMLPITPSRTFDTTSLKEGKIHLDILAGRESVRGSTGGSQAVTVESGSVRLSVGAGALPEDTAIGVSGASLAPFVPSGGGLVALEQVSVDLSGRVLGSTAELSVAATGGVTGDDTLLVAQVVRVDDVPRLVVVAAGQLVVDRIVSRPIPGLPGIVDGGDYVFYRSAPVAFVAGVTSSSAGPVKAVVTTDTLPFIGYARNDGSYIVAARPGAVAVGARVPRTSLVGHGTVVASAAETAILPIALSGQVTTAVVSPADGSVAVPTSTQLEIDASAPLNAATVIAANTSLSATGSMTPVPVRLILSGSGRSLAVVPQSALASATAYVFAASGLADVYGGLVQVPSVHFTTKGDTAAAVDKDALVFSFPDAGGMVRVTAASGSLPPGSTVMIINSGNGVVATFTADNDGAVGLLVPAAFPASISDALLVTITDPLGNVTTFTRSQFVDAATGQTAVGPGGGTVTASDGSGVELRIPEGALDKGAVFKINLVDTASLQQLFPDQKPEVPGGTVAGALKIETSNAPAFRKEVKLAFPLPDFSKGAVVPDNPESAFYYAYRRLQGPGDQYLFETLDEAFVERDASGNPAKIVTASPPFGGYENTFGAFDVNGVVSGQNLNYAFLMWTYDQLQPGKPLAGAVTGRVTRGMQTAAGVTYVGIPGVLVRGKDQAGNPLQSGAAITDPSGTYTLLDAQYTGGPVTVQASFGGQTLTATGYQVNPQDGGVPALLHLYRRVAIADVTFPPEPAQAPPPEIRIQVMKVVNGQRQDTGGLVAANTPLVIGFTTNLTIQSASVQNGSAASLALTVRGPLTADPTGFTFTAESSAGPYTPTQSGTYTLSATGLPAFGPPVTQSLTFRVTGAGGGIDNVPGVPPAVVTARTSPRPGSAGVPVDVLPEIAFTEPVRQLLGNVTLSELDASGNATASVPMTLLGVDAAGQPTTVSGASTVVTALTVQPAIGLRFSTKYRLALTSGIVDLDTPTPNALVPFQTDFTTFGPASLGDGTGNYASPGIVVLANRAYLVQNSFARGDLKAYDIDDPVSPREIVFDAAATGQTMEQVTLSSVASRPVDIAGEKESPLTGGRVVVIATVSTNLPKPSNLHVFDVSDDTHPHLIGAASVSSSAVEGTVARVRVANGLAYTLTSHRGLQVVDLQRAVANLRQATGDLAYSTGYWDMIRSLGTDGQGFGQDAVQVTIPVNKAAGTPYYMADMAVASLLLDNVSQPLMLATGELGLAIGGAVQPGSLLYPAPQDPQTVEDASGRLVSGQVIAAAHIGDRDIAAIAGSGFVKNGNGTQTAGLVLAAVDVTNPRQPRTLRLILLDGGNPAAAATDLIFKGSLALVATADDVRLVNLADPTNPALAGVLRGLGGILALSESNLIFSTAHSVFGGADPANGVHVATLGPLPYITPPPPTLARVIEGGGETQVETLDDIPVQVRVFPADYPVAQGLLQLFANGNPYGAPAAISLANGLGRSTIPKGLKKALNGVVTGVMSIFAENRAVPSVPQKIDIGAITLTVDSNNDTVVDGRDDAAVRDDANKDDPAKAVRFAFWDAPYPNVSGVDSLVDYATVRLHVPVDVPPGLRVGLMLPSGDWELHRKVDLSDFQTLVPAPPPDCIVEGKLHLCNEAASRVQAILNTLSGPLAPSASSASGTVAIPTSLLTKGDHDLLFKCHGRSDGNPGCPGDTIRVVHISDSSVETMDQRRVEVRPIKSLATVVSARRGDPPSDEQYRVAPAIREEGGWAPIPADIPIANLIVHGFNVSDEDMKNTSFPAWLKRLYWSGHPVLGAQGAHTIGLSWVGDVPGAVNPGLYFPEDEFTALQTGVPLAKFIKQRLLSGPPNRRVNILAHSLGNLAVHSALRYLQPSDLGTRTVTYVMNDAAVPADAFSENYDQTPADTQGTAPDLLEHAVRLGYKPTGSEERILADRGFAGIPSEPDAAWSQQWEKILRWIPRSCSEPEPAGDPLLLSECQGAHKWVSDYAQLNAALKPRTVAGEPAPPDSAEARGFFASRWSLNRSVTGRGPWRGIFAANLGLGIKIYNTYNSTDWVLRLDIGGQKIDLFHPHAYYACQWYMKPYGYLVENLLRESTDTLIGGPSESAEVRWPLLNPPFTAVYGRSTSDPPVISDQNLIWGDGQGHDSETRGWAELAYWFPAFTVPAGAQPVKALEPASSSPSDSRNIDLNLLGGGDEKDDFISHGYLASREFAKVFAAYHVIRTKIDQ